MNFQVFFKLSLFLLIIFMPSGAFAAKLAKATIVVVGENGLPIEGAEIYILRDGPGGVATKGTSSKGIANSEGEYSATSLNYNGYLAYGARKEGYYRSSHEFQYTRVGLWQWEPWNPKLTVILRKIEDPVPMYARDTLRSKIEIPVVNQDVGFDLVEFDWIAPYGMGTHADFIFNLERLPVVSRKNYDATLTITFSNRGDGIQPVRENLRYGSQFKLPRYAPETGYESKLVLHRWYTPESPDNKNFNFMADDLNYVFRIRSTEKDGKIERSMYGKTRSYISFTAMESKTAKIYFTYYLNPDYTRNLEFDPKRNLFGKLSDLERVPEP